MSIHTQLATLTVLSVLPFAAMAQDRTPSHASVDDCAVMAEAGEAKLKWREQSPDMPMSPRSYGVDCGWKPLGMKDFAVSPPDQGPYFKGLRFSFSRPVYSADGLMAALDYTVAGNGGPHNYFISISHCTAKKVNGRWQIEACKPGPIT